MGENPYGQKTLRALNQYIEHYHSERDHPRKGNLLRFPRAPSRFRPSGGKILLQTRLNFYTRAA